MKTLQSRWPGGKYHRPTFAAFTAQAIAQREQRDDASTFAEFTPMASDCVIVVHKKSATCCAYTDAGNICGVSPAPFLDLMRGGFVCAAHKPERWQS